MFCGINKLFQGYVWVVRRKLGKCSVLNILFLNSDLCGFKVDPFVFYLILSLVYPCTMYMERGIAERRPRPSIALVDLKSRQLFCAPPGKVTNFVRGFS